MKKEKKTPHLLLTPGESAEKYNFVSFKLNQILGLLFLK